MHIDLSLPPGSARRGFLDLPWCHAKRHFTLTRQGKAYGLSPQERISHAALGVLKLVPLFGMAAVAYDLYTKPANPTLLKLTKRDPFARGKEHGQKLKKEIRATYRPVLSLGWREGMLSAAQTFERQIPPYLLAEMQGLAEGASLPYEEVLLVHTLLDIYPGHFGCTAMAFSEETGARIVIANHADQHPSTTLDSSSLSRESAFLSSKITPKTPLEPLLLLTERERTIQSMIFNITEGKLSISTSGSYAAHGHFHSYGPASLFGNSHLFPESRRERLFLLRNLDWPWFFLGERSLLLSRPLEDGANSVTITWPGYIGTLSGINSDGVTIIQNACGYESYGDKIPNPLLLTSLLDQCHSSTMVDQLLRNNLHGSSANLLVVDPTVGYRYVLGENRLYLTDRLYAHHTNPSPPTPSSSLVTEGDFSSEVPSSDSTDGSAEELV